MSVDVPDNFKKMVHIFKNEHYKGSKVSSHVDLKCLKDDQKIMFLKLNRS